MIEYNYSRLLKKMREKSLTQEEIAWKIGKNPSTINLKLKNKNRFLQDEMEQILSCLNVDISDIHLYFFAH